MLFLIIDVQRKCNLGHNLNSMQKSHIIEHPVSDLIKNRKSVRAFTSTPIEQEKIYTLFEATRWAPSSTNEQPWLYLYATKDQTEFWNKLFSPLNAGNKTWAKDAPLLILSLARKNFTRFAGANLHAMYDLGGANSFLSRLGTRGRQGVPLSTASRLCWRRANRGARCDEPA